MQQAILANKLPKMRMLTTMTRYCMDLLSSKWHSCGSYGKRILFNNFQDAYGSCKMLAPQKPSLSMIKENLLALLGVARIFKARKPRRRQIKVSAGRLPLVQTEKDHATIVGMDRIPWQKGLGRGVTHSH